MCNMNWRIGLPLHCRPRGWVLLPFYWSFYFISPQAPNIKTLEQRTTSSTSSTVIESENSRISLKDYVTRFVKGTLFCKCLLLLTLALEISLNVDLWRWVWCKWNEYLMQADNSGEKKGLRHVKLNFLCRLPVGKESYVGVCGERLISETKRAFE